MTADAVAAPFPVHGHAANSASAFIIPIHQQHSTGADNLAALKRDGMGGGGIGLVQFLFRWNLLLHHEDPHPDVDGALQFRFRFYQLYNDVIHLPSS